VNPAGDLVIHINGWPGTGKLTVARHLAKALDARLLDNHLLFDPASALFSRSDPLHASLRGEIRRAVFDHAKRAGPNLRLIFTDALSDDEYDQAMFAEYRDLASARSATLVAIVLECSLEENLHRLQAASRAGSHKLTDPAILHSMRRSYRLLRPAADRLIEIDTTGLPAEDVARLILSDLGV